MIKTAISFAFACALFLQLPYLPSLNWLWLSLPACFLLQFTTIRYFAIMLLGGLWTLFYAHLIISDRLPHEIAGKEITISGIISSVPERQQQRIRFEFKPEPSTQFSLPNKIRLNWYKPLPTQLNAGERWQLTVKLKPVRGMMNPGSFDYEAWLFEQAIGATGYVRTSDKNVRIEPAPFYSINSWRQSLVKKIEAVIVDSPNLGLIEGLTTGIRHHINQKQWQILRQSGTNHLLAISGLHIGLAATIGFFLFRFLWSLRAKNLLLLTATEVGAVGGFILALFYAALAGFSIPTQRALIMVATVMVSLIIRRPIMISHILAISLLLVLVFDPLSVLSVGFWLSFSAVTIILLVSQHRYPTPKWQWAKIHFLIAFGLSPLLLFFFLETSIIAPVANFVAIPFISLLVVPLLLFSSLFLFIWPALAEILLHLTDKLLSFIWPFLDVLASLPFSHWQSLSLPLYYWAPIIMGSLLLLTPRHFPAKWLGLLGLTPLFLWSPIKPDEGDFWFTLLDVGQGLSAIIQTQQHTLVFDTGPKFGDNFNTGTAIVKPFLQQSGIQTIDTLIVSHGDNDHIGGAIPLLNDVETIDILSSTPNLLPKASLCKAGQSWQWDNVMFSILHPTEQDNDSENNLSCVLRVSNSTGSVLLSGDIEQEAEKLLIQRYGAKLHASILVAPHHGSKTSSSLSFINAVSPEFVLFPVGYRNRYHFPHKTVVDRYKSKEVRLLNTADHGAISFKFGTQLISEPITWRQENHKMWTSN